MREERGDAIQRVVQSGTPARSAMAASWRRCTHAYGLDPAIEPEIRVLEQAELREALDRSGPVLTTARPVLDRLRHATRNQPACVMYSDADGVPLAWNGPQADAEELARRGLRPGADWSERAGGTNGIGTCLVEQRPLVVHRDQHFFPRGREISCAVAPVYGSDGALVGALNVTLYGSAVTQGWSDLLMETVSDAALRIEADHFHCTFANACILSIPGPMRGAALIALDSDDVVLGATRSARRLLGITPERLRAGLCLQDLLPETDDNFESAERGVLRRALLRHRGNVTASARSLGISRATIKRKITHHDLRPKR